MDYDLIVRSTGLDVGIGDGVIGATADGGTLAGSAAAELDAGTLCVMAGGVDAHVHANEPGRTEWEGFATISAALAAGGFTALCDMPLNAMPATVDAEAFDLKLACASRSSIVDFGLWGGLVPGNLGELETLHARGVVGFKAFMCNTGIDDFLAVDDAALWAGMREIAALGSILAVHAENDAITRALTASAPARGAAAYLASRPPVVELEAIGRAVALAADTGCALHIVHVSTAAGVEAVRRAREHGVDVSWETTPHHLLLTGDDVERIGLLAKCSPVMHDEANRRALIAHVSGDSAAIVASDHSPAPLALKSGRDFFAAWGGISGAQTTRSLLLHAAAAGELPFDAVVRATSDAPAARLRLAGKGRLSPGYDADLAVVDLDATWRLAAAELRYRHPHSPFIGRTMRGAVRHLLRRGRPLIHDGRPCVADRGRLLTPLAAGG